MKFDASVDKALAAKLSSALKDQTKNLGIVEAASSAQREGQSGFLVWHYVFHNEVSFVTEDGQIESLYTSIGDDYAIAEYDRLKIELNA
ncbi:MAG: hypothetical protein P1V97_01875 [Planctomycetota bacterium]|nr:hypothetical protein [Planctomycetota bacterium]